MASALPPSSLSPAERAARSRLRQLLGQADGFLHASLIEMVRRCGNRRCACARDEARKHRSLYIGQTVGGKTRMRSVPKEREEEVRRHAENYRRARALLEELSEEGWRRAEAAASQRRKSKTQARGKKAGRSDGRARKGRKPKDPS